MDSPPMISAASVAADAYALLDRASAPLALLVPTVAAVVDAVPAWQARWRTLVAVAPGLPGGLAPAELLPRLHAASRPEHVLVFSDQLVSAAHAALPVRSGEDTLYLSGIEAVLASHGYTLTCSMAVTARPCGCTSPVEAMRLVVAHLKLCQHLGAAWRMRDGQAARSLASRVDSARRENRLLESALLHSSMRHQIDAGAVLSRVRAAARSLKEVERTC